MLARNADSTPSQARNRISTMPANPNAHTPQIAMPAPLRPPRADGASREASGNGWLICTIASGTEGAVISVCEPVSSWRPVQMAAQTHEHSRPVKENSSGSGPRAHYRRLRRLVRSPRRRHQDRAEARPACADLDQIMRGRLSGKGVPEPRAEVVEIFLRDEIAAAQRFYCDVHRGWKE